ncbi:MAG: beta family protein [Treponema sp.]|nr:beta family protein [Treponema sp.]
MNKYSPFLKFKDGELTALFNLDIADRNSIVPLLEISRDDKLTEITLKTKIDRCSKRMSGKLESSFSFFIDNLEVPDKITINGDNNYLYLLNSFSNFDIIPVIGFDRVQTHKDICIDYANYKTRKIALRITQDYFDGFLAYKKDLNDIIKRIKSDVNIIALLDCNYIDNDAIAEKCKINIIRILDYLKNMENFTNFVITGSSLPTPIGDKVKTGTYVKINRHEIKLFGEILNYYPELNLIFGDYTIVDPGYSEINIDPKAMLNVITPKIIYSTLESQYIIRGHKIKTHGFDQYFSQGKTIINEKFFRGKNFSWGDNYLHERTKQKTKKITPSSIIGPTVNAHIKFMINEIIKGSI